MKFAFVPTAAAILTLCLAAVPVAAQDTVAGNWDLSLETPQGANPVTVSFKLDGNKLSGELSGPMGAVPVTGTVTGAVADFTANIDVQGFSLALGFHGTLAGETLNGTVKAGDFGEFPFTGKRAGAATATAAAAPAAAPVAAAGGNATGKWAIVMTIDGVGDVPAFADFTQEGTVVTGSIAAAMGGESVPLKGTFEGNQLKIEFTAQTPQGPLPITITGELGAAGFTGKASLAGVGEASWKGTRQ